MEVTKVIYYVGEEDTPYLVKVQVPPGQVRLLDFKSALPQPADGYTFFFKSIDEDVGFVKEEICEDGALLPIHNGRVTSWLVQNFHLRTSLLSPSLVPPHAEPRRSPSSYNTPKSAKSNAPASPKKLKKVHNETDRQILRSPSLSSKVPADSVTDKSTGPDIAVEKRSEKKQNVTASQIAVPSPADSVTDKSTGPDIAVEKRLEKKQSVTASQIAVPSLPMKTEQVNVIKSHMSDNIVSTKSTAHPVARKRENGEKDTEVVPSIQIVSKPANPGTSSIFRRLLAISTMEMTTRETPNMSNDQAAGPSSVKQGVQKDLKKEIIKPEINEESWDDPKTDCKPKDLLYPDDAKESNMTKVSKKELKTIPTASQAPVKEHSSNDPRLKAARHKSPVGEVTMTTTATKTSRTIPKRTLAIGPQPASVTTSAYPRIPVSTAQPELKPPYCWGWSLSIPNVIKSDSMTASTGSSTCSSSFPEKAKFTEPTALIKSNAETDNKLASFPINTSSSHCKVGMMAENKLTEQRAQVKKRKASTNSDKRGASSKRTKITDGNDEIIVLGA